MRDHAARREFHVMRVGDLPDLNRPAKPYFNQRSQQIDSRIGLGMLSRHRPECEYKGYRQQNQSPLKSP